MSDSNTSFLNLYIAIFFFVIMPALVCGLLVYTLGYSFLTSILACASLALFNAFIAVVIFSIFIMIVGKAINGTYNR